MAIYKLSEYGESPALRDCDVCVIGTGFAGLVAARHLARGGKHVIALESGREDFDAGIHELNDIDHKSGRYTGASLGRFRGLGGSSSQWSGGLLPITADEAAPRPYLNLPGWPFPISELDIYQPVIETMLGVDNTTFGAELFSRDHYPITETEDFQVRWIKLTRVRRRHIGRNVRAAAKLPNFDIWTDATACGFTLDRERGRIRTILAKNLAGRQLEVSAKQFIFAAGTIETTRLALLLDAASDGRAYARCRVLGCYFQDHLLARVGSLQIADPYAANRLLAYRFQGSTARHFHLELRSSAQADDEVHSAFAQVKMRIPSDSPLLLVKNFANGLQNGRINLPPGSLRALKSGIGYLGKLAWWRCFQQQLAFWEGVSIDVEICAEQKPRSDNRIVLSNERDALGVPKVELRWSPDEADEQTFRSTFSRLSGYWARSPLALACPILPSAAARDNGLRIIDNARDMYHPSGSTRMGHDPVTSVVNPNLSCHHVENLAIASASTFPVAGSANPTYTIMQVALRAADAILAGRRC